MPTTTLPNKIIAVLLSFALVFSFTPNIAFADNETNSQTTTEEAGSGENSTNENITDSSSTDGTDPFDYSTSSQNDSASNSSTSAVGSNEKLNSNTRIISNDNDQTDTEEADNEANDQANSWRYIDGEQIYSYEGASTEAVDPNTPMPLAAAPGASSYATWYKSNGTTSYTYKETPSSSGQNISVSGVKRVGIDVSYHQGTIDWAKVKNSGVSFAIIRCGYGSNFTNQDDTQFLNNVRGAQANGIDIGIYLYSYAQNTTGNDSSATSEAQHVLRLLNEAGLEPSDLAYPVYYDLEESSQANLGPSKIAGLATTFCNIISDAGYDVGIYANQNWWRNYLTDSVFSTAGWNKWVARYPGQNKATDSGVSGTEIWQFSDCGSVDGISGNCDMNFDYVGFGGKWVKEKGYWYYQKNGENATGWTQINNKWYYLDPSDGHMLTGLQEIEGKWYYLTPGDSGWAVTGWQKLNDQWYYFKPAPSCAAATGWTQINNKWYYLDPSDGHMLTGLQEIEGKWYYFAGGDDGWMLTGWQEINGEWHYFEQSSGAGLIGWHTIDGFAYYFNPDEYGSISIGFNTIDNKLFYFGQDGKLVTDSWISIDDKTYFADLDGELIYTWNADSNGNCYIANLNGEKQFGWIACGTKRYYADSDTGFLQESGICQINGVIYEFNDDYSLKTGWTKRSDDNWYYLDEDGVPVTGWKKISNYWYYLDKKSGAMLTGWQWIDGYWYYFKIGDSGAMLTGWQWIDGKRYYFKPSGALVEGGEMAIKAQQYSSGTNYLILVDCSSHTVGVFSGSVNNWTLYYSWSCVTGAPSSPTIKGTYHTTGFKRGSLSTDSRAIYCTQIWGGYFFHSILASESELGQSLSHGCIRLPYPAAQWIYNNINAGTTVVIYN